MTPRERAAGHAARRRKRLSRIRTTVAAASVCLFILLFSGIYVQMAAGSDPALSVSHAKKAATTSTGSSSSSSSTQASPVTTSQS